MERLQKLISQCGVASRRAAEELILSGKVTVNGVPASLGDKADLATDVIMVNGKPLVPQEEHIYLMLNKPRGYITTMKDEKDRKTVCDLVKTDVRVYPVGRLDYQSEGLLLMTNDGTLTYQLTHPKHDVPKEYLVTVTGDLESALVPLQLPMVIDGRETAPADVEVLKEHSGGGLLSIIIHEGRNRQIRKLCEAAGLTVNRLKRIAIGELTLGKLPSGRWRMLTEEEVSYLKELAACSIHP